MLKVKLEEFKRLSKEIFEEYCKENNLPIPKIVFAPCPSMTTTSCIMSNVNDCRYEDGELKGCKHEGTTVYLNPWQYSLRTILHEATHYSEAANGNATKATDEDLAEEMARKIITENFPIDIDGTSTSTDMTMTDTNTNTDTDKGKEQCLPCSIKHLLSAKINAEEALASNDKERQREKILNTLGHIQEAENHLVTERPDLAQKVREIRKKYEFVRDPTHTIIEELMRLVKMLDDEREKEQEQKEQKEQKDAEEYRDTNTDTDTDRDREDKDVGVEVGVGVEVPVMTTTTATDTTAITATAIDINNNEQYTNHMSMNILANSNNNDKDKDNKMSTNTAAKASTSASTAATITITAPQLFARPISENFDSLYSMLGLDRLTGLDARTLNEANTPEIIGWFIDTIQDMSATPFGHILNNLVLGTGLYLAQGLFADHIAPSDRRFLANLGSHFFWRLISLLNPANRAVAQAQAQAFGASLARQDYAGAAEQILLANPLTSIRNMIDDIMRNITGGSSNAFVSRPVSADSASETTIVANPNLIETPQSTTPISGQFFDPETPNLLPPL